MPSPTKSASTTTTTTAVLAKAKGMSSHHHHQPPHHQLFQPQQEQHQHHLNPGMAAFVAPAEGPPSQPITMPYGTLQLASPAQQEAFAGVLGAGHIATGLSDDDDDEGDEDESATSGGGKRKRASSRATTKATKSSSTSGSSASTSTSAAAAAAAAAAASTSRAGGLAEVKGERDAHTGRRKIRIEFIEDDSRRHITFSKRKAGIMKKAYELATLTGTQVLLLIVSQTGLVYTFTTPKLQPIVATDEGRELIQRCLSKPDSLAEDAGKEGEHGDDDEDDEGEEQEEEKPQFQQAMQQSQQQQQQQQHHHQQQHSMPIHQQQYAGMAPYPDPRLNPAIHGLSDLGDMSGLTMGGHSYAYPPHQQQQSQHHHQQSHAQAPPVSQQQSQPQQGGHSHQQQAPQQHHQPHMGGQTDQHAMPYGNYGL